MHGCSHPARNVSTVKGLAVAIATHEARLGSGAAANLDLAEVCSRTEAFTSGMSGAGRPRPAAVGPR